MLFIADSGNVIYLYSLYFRIFVFPCNNKCFIYLFIFTQFSPTYSVSLHFFPSFLSSFLFLLSLPKSHKIFIKFFSVQFPTQASWSDNLAFFLPRNSPPTLRKPLGPSSPLLSCLVAL